MEFKIYGSLNDFYNDNLEQKFDSSFDKELKKYSKYDINNFLVRLKENDKVIFGLSNEEHFSYLGPYELLKLLIDTLVNYNFNFKYVSSYNAASILKERLGGIFLYSSKYDACLYEDKEIKHALFAGGCFWCVSKEYYNKKGIRHIFSGYSGGSEIQPKYEDVKAQKTHHRETIMIEYDPKIISYKELLDIYFNSIDPTDGDGQFIDRGKSYSPAIYVSSFYELLAAREKIEETKKIFNQEIKVQIENKEIFYMAEEYHQDFAIKHKDKLDEEFKISKRNEFFKEHDN